jgi:hypothetical protein
MEEVGTQSKVSFYYLRKQIQPTKHFVGPSRGISVPLMKKFWGLC